MSRALTAVGLNRERYSAEVEPAPSRFTGPDGPNTYREWCERADATPGTTTLNKGVES